MHPESYSVGRSEAAQIVGIKDVTLRNLMNREGLFASRRRGSGHHLAFTIRELMQVGTVKRLMEMSFDASEAVGAVEPFSVYGHLLKNGCFMLGWDEHQKRWNSKSWAPNGTYLRVALWPIFDEIIQHWIGDSPDDEAAAYLQEIKAHHEAQE